MIHLEATKLLLDSIYSKHDDGLKHSFLTGPTGSFQKNLGVELYYDKKNLIKAVLYVRQNGPSYLKQIAINDIWKLLTNFISDNYWHLRAFAFRQFEGSYLTHTSPDIVNEISLSLAKSAIFDPSNILTLYPLIPIKIEANFKSKTFFLVEPDSLDKDVLPEGFNESLITKTLFPPVEMGYKRREYPAAWLGINSPSAESANKIKKSILGAVSLRVNYRSRYMVSGREMFGGCCTLTKSDSTSSYGNPHTPPLMYDFILKKDDHAWLSILEEKILSVERSNKRQIWALEYFYRAWPLDENERYPFLFTVLEALYGDIEKATQSIIDGVLANNDQFNEEKLRTLLGLRADVFHGRAPDPFDSKGYAKYYSKYESNPISDLEKIAEQCLNYEIFKPQV